MNRNEVEILDNLDFHDWYSELASKYESPVDKMLSKPNRREVEKIINDLGYVTQYYSSSKIFNIPTKFNGTVFYCNSQFNYGDVRVYMYCEKGDRKFGGNLISMCRLYEIAKGKDSGSYMLSPRFSSYQELKEILKEVFKMYEKFKLAVYESKILDHPA